MITRRTLSVTLASTPGFEPGPSRSVAEIDSFIAAEHKRWGEVIRAAGIKPQ